MSNFISNSTFPDNVNPNSLWFIFFEDQIVLKINSDQHSIPRLDDYSLFENHVSEKYYIGSFEGVDCYAALLSESIEVENYEIMRLRKAYYCLEETTFWLAGRVFQTVFFHHNHLFCGVCGHATEVKDDEFARICTSCKTTFYSQQAPAVIVAIIKEDKILLARARRFPTSMYSVLAGFVEPGESLEDCVRREIREESGIKVKNIKYFGSQPWPFPNSLMIGFTAEYDSGELIIDEKEIVDADWYSYDKLPLVPDHASIARKLIDWFVEKCQTK